jgi:hypothetical protein
VEKEYINLSVVKKGYKDQLIYYYNNIGEKSGIAGCIITEKMINVIEKRYLQLGGVLPVSEEEILEKKGKKWHLI